jgi:hypothetical protein
MGKGKGRANPILRDPIRARKGRAPRRAGAGRSREQGENAIIGD